jgi:hypothetical protein
MAARLTGGRGKRWLTMALRAPAGGAAGISTRSVERRDMTQQSAVASGARRHAPEADGLERMTRRRSTEEAQHMARSWPSARRSRGLATWTGGDGLLDGLR